MKISILAGLSGLCFSLAATGHPIFVGPGTVGVIWCLDVIVNNPNK